MPELHDMDKCIIEGMFSKIAMNLTGDEDAFTAFLAVVANEVPDLGRTILEWVKQKKSPTCSYDTSGHWTFQGQYKFTKPIKNPQKDTSKVSSCEDDIPSSQIDMVARCEDNPQEIREIWFEHKYAVIEMRGTLFDYLRSMEVLFSKEQD